ncbi:hypothetical protein QIS74_04776 [Colletotrichum tabaci]|uniref:GH18 domain-containing protein n=1 Tax=Colletotrichum tabaci TaxID=1209068 RepID=A0AAV9TIA1_9PEZI
MGSNVYGCIKQLFLLKLENRQLKVVLSIGGASWSSHFATVASSQQSRELFADSSVTLMKDWGFDGIDIDWEFPQSKVEAADYVLLLQAITTAEIAKNISDTFEILDKDQAQRRITVPSQISEPLKSVATKVEGHVATAVASAKQAISTPLTNVWKEIRPKFLDDLTRWRNTVPVYCCLQTRGVWQLGYPDSTTKLVPSQDFNMVEAFQIKELSELFSAAHKIVPGLPDSLASDLGNVDFGVVDRIVVVIYGLLLALLVGTFVTIVVSIFLPQTA